MSKNWIIHSPSNTPEVMTDEDICYVDNTLVGSFYTHTRQAFIEWAGRSSGGLPHALHCEASTCEADALADVLRTAIADANVMDSGWVDDYRQICERVSADLGGYPKACLKQWRSIRITATGRSSFSTRPRKDSAAHIPKENEAPKHFRFLELPAHLRHRIYRLVIPSGTLTIGDWALGSFPNSVYKRTEYDVPDVDNDMRRTTYLVHAYTPPCGINLNLMRASRFVHRETAPILYSTTQDPDPLTRPPKHAPKIKDTDFSIFSFRGTASGTLAFLHDHMKPLSRIKKISLRYITTSKTPFLGCTFADSKPPPTLKTNGAVFRKTIAVLRSAASALEDFELVVDKHFWERAPWRSGADAVLRDRALCEPNAPAMGAPVKNFLVDVARLAGVNFRLVVEGVEGDRVKSRFVREVEEAVTVRMRGMPYEAGADRACVCRKRLLSEACAWDGNGEGEAEVEVKRVRMR